MQTEKVLRLESLLGEGSQALSMSMHQMKKVVSEGGDKAMDLVKQLPDSLAQKVRR